MINDENEKIAVCPVYLEGLITDLYFTCDDYLYHQFLYQNVFVY